VDPGLVRIDLHLAGGHRQTLELPADSPILRGLVDAFVARVAGAHRRIVLFQIPLEEGRCALSFTSDQLVALSTAPPVLAGTEDVVVTPDKLGLVAARYTCLRDVLGAEAKTRLLDAAIASVPELAPSRVTTNIQGHRRSRVRSRAGDLAADLVARVRAKLPELCARLDVAPFPVGEIEAQLTVHQDGDYYRVHADNDDESTRTREISYVYYFHREPRRFTGGELVLFDTRIEHGQSFAAGPPLVVEPVDDSLVVFPSGCLHEVRPVQLLSTDPGDGRFTINGWVRRGEAALAG
jgi:Rps23 Pro-64 3,4-dihydroxylase Tpa1-like proline 4-hydroxylase